MFMIRQGATPVVRRHDGTASFGYEIVEPSMPGAHQLSFGALAIGTNVLRALCGPDFRLLQVTFAFDRPRNLSLFRSFFGAPVSFGAAANAIDFDARWLATPIATADSYLYAVLADDVRRDADRTHEPAENRVLRVVRSLVAGGQFSADAAADAFGVTRRTLARRLRDRGTSFRALLDDARHCDFHARFPPLVRYIAAALAGCESPLAVIEAHHQDEFARRRREPVGLLVHAWRLVLPVATETGSGCCSSARRGAI